MEIIEAARELATHRVWLFFKLGPRFLSPLVEAERRQLEESAVLEDRGALRVVLILGERIGTITPGIYSPVPIARGLGWGAEGEPEAMDEALWARLLGQFRYETIRVDEDQVWWWKGNRVAPRIRAFFLEHLAWEPELGLWSVEYRIHDEWIDKCYLEGSTPMLGTALELGDDGPRVVLENGARDRVDLGTLRLDEKERLYVRGESAGEVLLSSGLRFTLLKDVADDLRSVEIGGVAYALAWPEDRPG